ncbi:hypothetical protein, partial [Streptomyces musisoli]|uniref:hypothetical protein n=1 Tax=Streptomyces musisoli TaxID=2802280 RepID=UPI001F31506A
MIGTNGADAGYDAPRSARRLDGTKQAVTTRDTRPFGSGVRAHPRANGGDTQPADEHQPVLRAGAHGPLAWTSGKPCLVTAMPQRAEAAQDRTCRLERWRPRPYESPV